jgi:isoquinoline 1-oxidoreductase subunit alpha
MRARAFNCSLYTWHTDAMHQSSDALRTDAGKRFGEPKDCARPPGRVSPPGLGGGMRPRALEAYVIEFELNGSPQQVDVPPETPLLWVLRETLGLTGTKFGCGIGMCGACTVHFNGQAMRTCILPVVAVAGSKVTTIEGLDHVVKQAWIDHQVPQCGYCQPGQLMAASALLDSNAHPTDADINAHMTNLCRCATYGRIRKAIHSAAAKMPAPAPAIEAPKVGIEGDSTTTTGAE